MEIVGVKGESIEESKKRRKEEKKKRRKGEKEKRKCRRRNARHALSEGATGCTRHVILVRLIQSRRGQLRNHWNPQAALIILFITSPSCLKLPDDYDPIRGM
jgi:hypothetical protein